MHLFWKALAIWWKYAKIVSGRSSGSWWHFLLHLLLFLLLSITPLMFSSTNCWVAQLCTSGHICPDTSHRNQPLDDISFCAPSPGRPSVRFLFMLCSALQKTRQKEMHFCMQFLALVSPCCGAAVGGSFMSCLNFAVWSRTPALLSHRTVWSFNFWFFFLVYLLPMHSAGFTARHVTWTHTQFTHSLIYSPSQSASQSLTGLIIFKNGILSRIQWMNE